MESKELQNHISATYFTLRWGLAVLAIALPLVLWTGGHIFKHLALQASMSAYYHAGDGVMRDAFVGILFAVSFFLILYKGFTYFENYAFNFAGLFLAGVALFPMEWNCGDACSRTSLHGTLSALFFLSIAYVCIFRASDTLGLMPDQAMAKWYRRIYKLLGAGMIVSPLIAAILSSILEPHSAKRSTIFFAEATGIYIFAAYWIVKSIEIKKTDSVTLAMQGKLITEHYRATDIFKQISVERVHPQGKEVLLQGASMDIDKSISQV